MFTYTIPFSFTTERYLAERFQPFWIGHYNFKKNDHKKALLAECSAHSKCSREHKTVFDMRQIRHSEFIREAEFHVQGLYKPLLRAVQWRLLLTGTLHCSSY